MVFLICLQRSLGNLGMLAFAALLLLCSQSLADTNASTVDWTNITVLMRLTDPFTAAVNGKPPSLTPLNPSRVSGYCPELVAELAHDMGFNYTVYLVDTSNAAIDGIAADQFTFSCGNLVITDQRYTVVDFTQPFLPTATCVVIPVDPATSDELWGFLQPFTMPLWGCILATMVCFSLLLWFLEVVWTEKDDRDDDLDTIWNSLYWGVASILAYGWLQPRSMAGKAIWAAYYLYVLVVVASYTANLAAALATKSSSADAVTSYDTLPGHSICAISGGNTEATIRRTLLQPTAQVTIQWTSQISDCLDMVVAKSVDAMVVGCPSAIFALTSNKSYCDLMTIGPDVYPSYYGLAVGKGHSDFLDQLNIQLLQYQQNGRLDQLAQQYFVHEVCPNTIEERQKQSETTTASQLSPGSFSGLYIVIFSIVGIGVVYRVVVQVMKCCADRKPKPEKENPSLMVLTDPLAPDSLSKPPAAEPSPGPEPDTDALTLQQFNEIVKFIASMNDQIDLRFQQMDSRLLEDEELLHQVKETKRYHKKDFNPVRLSPNYIVTPSAPTPSLSMRRPSGLVME